MKTLIISLLGVISATVVKIYVPVEVSPDILYLLCLLYLLAWEWVSYDLDIEKKWRSLYEEFYNNVVEHLEENKAKKMPPTP